MKFSAEIKADVEVIFADPDKAKATFIDGDWREAFWDIDGMEDLARDLAFAVHSQPERWTYDEEQKKGYWQKSPEGFGEYIKDITSNSWIMDNEETGKITVVLDDMDIEGVCEVEEELDAE